MNDYLKAPEISEYAENKKGFELSGKAFLRQLSGDISRKLSGKYGEQLITDSKVSFNPGGPAVAGDPSLYLMTDKNKGLAVYISDSFKNSSQHIMFREISSMKDYRGGNNNWLSVKKPYEEIVSEISKFLDKAIIRTQNLENTDKEVKSVLDGNKSEPNGTIPAPFIPADVEPRDRVKAITAKLEEGIKNLFESDKFKDYLNTMSKFHNYSFSNTLLIAMQKPDASLVAGFNTWKNQFGRHVNKGEKGITILAPTPFKIKKEVEKIDKNTGFPVLGKDGKPIIEEVEETVPYFKSVHVYDISQTNGRELPTLGAELSGSVKDYDKLFEALKALSPVPIGFEKITDNSKGYYHHEEKRIAIKEGMSELQNVKTAIHEIAHAKLHDRDLIKADLAEKKDRKTGEVEALCPSFENAHHL